MKFEICNPDGSSSVYFGLNSDGISDTVDLEVVDPVTGERLKKGTILEIDPKTGTIARISSVHPGYGLALNPEGRIQDEDDFEDDIQF